MKKFVARKKKDNSTNTLEETVIILLGSEEVNIILKIHFFIRCTFQLRWALYKFSSKLQLFLLSLHDKTS